MSTSQSLIPPDLSRIVIETRNLVTRLTKEEKAWALLWIGYLYNNAKSDPISAMIYEWPSRAPRFEVELGIRDLNSGRLAVSQSYKMASATGILDHDELAHMKGSIDAYFVIISSLIGGLYQDQRVAVSAIWVELAKGQESIDTVVGEFRRLCLKSGGAKHNIPPVDQLSSFATFIPPEYKS